jgi:hypothetical protein
MRNKATIHTPVLSLCQTLAHPASTLRAILGRVRWIHLDYHPASVRSFAREDRDELPPSGITNALCEMMIFHHPFHIQFFDGNRVELSDDIERRLVMKIRALALNLPMLLLKQFDRLPSPITSLIGTARDATLSGLQFLFRRPVGLRIVDCLTGREHGEVLNPDIDPNRFAGLWNEPAVVLLDDKNDIPAVSFALDRAGLDRSFDWTGETDAARADFRQVKLVALKPESALWIGEGIESRGRLESRIPRCFSILHPTKESLEGLIHTAKSILKNLAVNGAYVFTDFFNRWKLYGLSVIVDRKSVDLIGVAPYVHLLFKTNPTIQLSKLVNNLKTVSSRLIRRDFRQHVNRIYRKPVFWHRSYCLISTGGATIEILRKYIEEQGYKE